MAQLVQLEAPAAEYWPCAQLEHDVEEVAASWEEKRPAEQTRQDA
jgi:hypothetical protein